MSGIFASRFAQTVTVTDASGSRQARAFLRPAALRSPETPTVGLPGWDDGRRWLLILEPLELSGQVLIDDGQRQYLLLRRELRAGHHWEGLLCRKAGEGHA